ncbi:addiction module toxin, HicA family [Candidatus Bathyarchaeota archaeon]|nr:addiction module toxin, HicA family [Candidatus Bathyarchaeota archaeon]
MRIPRDVSAKELTKLLQKYGFEITRQTGSHLRLTTHLSGEYHITIPNHDPIKIGTLNNILSDIAEYLGMNKKDLISELFA